MNRSRHCLGAFSFFFHRRHTAHTRRSRSFYASLRKQKNPKTMSWICSCTDHDMFLVIYPYEFKKRPYAVVPNPEIWGPRNQIGEEERIGDGAKTPLLASIKRWSTSYLPTSGKIFVGDLNACTRNFDFSYLIWAIVHGWPNRSCEIFQIRVLAYTPTISTSRGKRDIP